MKRDDIINGHGFPPVYWTLEDVKIDSFFDNWNPVKFNCLPDWEQYLDVDERTHTLIVYPYPVCKSTDPNVIKNWPKSMDEFLTKYHDRIKDQYKIEKIRRLDKKCRK